MKLPTSIVCSFLFHVCRLGGLAVGFFFILEDRAVVDEDFDEAGAAGVADVDVADVDVADEDAALRRFRFAALHDLVRGDSISARSG